MSSTRHHPPSPDHPKCDYTDKEVQIKPLIWFFIFTFAFCILVMAGLRIYLKDVEAGSFEHEQSLPGFVRERQLPPADMPLLQVRPDDELADHRAYERSLIDNGAAWADAGRTKARIPVTNAMEIMLARPDAFPVRGGN